MLCISRSSYSVNSADTTSTEIVETNNAIAEKTVSLSEIEKNVIEIKPAKLGWHRYVGILLGLLSMMTMSLMALTAKLLVGHHPFTLAIWRYSGNIVPTLPIVLYLYLWKRKPIFDQIWPLVGEKSKERRQNLGGIALRGLIGCGTTITRFSAQLYLNFADVSVITQSTPAIVFVFAFFCLGEKCSIISIISAALAISGVFVLSRPPLMSGRAEFDEDTLIGVGIATGTLFCSAASIILTRKLRKINFAVLVFGYGIGGILGSSILSFSFGVFKFPEGSRDILITIALAGLTCAGQCLTVLAIKYEEAGTYSIISISYVVFAFIWQIIFLHVYPDFITILGALIIVLGLLLTSLRKWVLTLPEEDSTRIRLNWLSR